MAPRIFATAPRFAALASLLVTVAGFIVIVAGLAKIQQATNRLGDLQAAGLEGAYSTTYNEALITPYPNNHHFQFSFIWFIIFGQLFGVLFCAAVLAVSSLHAGRLAALTFLAILTTLTINVVNNLVFLHKNATANTVYKPRDINVTLAGALLVVLGNVFTILTLGFFEPFGQTQTYYGTNKNQVAGNNGITTAETRV